MELVVSWAKIKACVDNHSNYLNWTDLDSEYVLRVEHRPFVYKCTIAKVSPRSSDQADFEDNYKE